LKVSSRNKKFSTVDKVKEVSGIPKLARKFLLFFLRKELHEEVLGDLEEGFHSTLKSESLFNAKVKYWYQVLRYLRPFAIRKFQSLNINHTAMYKSYLKIGWRNLVKDKGYSIINIGGLAIGMSVTLLIGLWIQDEFAFNKYHTNYDTIAKIYRTNNWGDGIESNTSQVAGLGTLLRNEYGAHFKSVVMVRQRIEDRVIAFGDNKFTQGGYFMQPEGIDVFSLRMIQGSAKRALRDMTSIILSESLSKKLFGEQDPLNKIVTMDGASNLLVTGIYQDLPKNSELFGATFFAPLDLFAGGPGRLDAFDNYNMTIYVQVHNATEVEKVSEVIKDAMLPYIDKETADTKPALFLLPMRDWHLNSQFENGLRVTSREMKVVCSYTTTGAFVLILAAINFMNLSTARSAGRAREVGIRKSIGSQRNQLIQQFLGESLLMASLSFLVSLVLAALALPSFNILAQKQLLMPWADYHFWITGISFAIFTGLMAGCYPAFYLSSFNPIKVLKGTFKVGQSASARNVLVTVQFIVSIGLAIGTIVVYQQIAFAKNRPVGYSREGLLSLQPRSPEFSGKYQVLRNELKKTGVVLEMGESNYSITSTLGWNGGFYHNGRKIGPSFNTIFVTHEYGKTVGLEFLQGRDFSRTSPADTAGILINESASYELGISDPVGEVLHWKPGTLDRGTFKILGIVKDMVKGSPFEVTDPSIIFLSNGDLTNLYIRINPAVSVHDALPKIQAVFQRIVPSAPFDYTFADEDYAAKFSAEERVGQLAGLFAIIALVISCLGLFGLTSFVAEQRTKEIGIRKVLGASAGQIWQMLSKDFILMVSIASIIASLVTFYLMDEWLQGYQYRIQISGWIFFWAAVGSIIVTFLTVSHQAIKAASMNPVKSLRSE
jgi:ABC-type antimicrobial peptide transport system permease subunit